MSLLIKPDDDESRLAVSGPYLVLGGKCDGRGLFIAWLLSLENLVFWSFGPHA